MATMTRMAFSTEGFCAALVSALVTSGITSIMPRSASARQGFKAILQSLDGAIEGAEGRDDRDLLYELLKIRTSLAPSSNGSYDNFESCLRVCRQAWCHRRTRRLLICGGTYIHLGPTQENRREVDSRLL
jgi:hypothetical protein